MFEFVGRADRQVKIRGFRVEPGEIETALNRIACVAASAVVPETDAAGHVHLVAYWVARDAASAAVETIVAELKRSLPDYMVPARIERVRELPLTPNGKIDRKRLQEAGVAESLQRWGANTQPDHAVAADPGDGVLAALTELASAVLRVPIAAGDADRPLGELGFDSIRYTALSTAVSRAMNVTLEEAAFYELKTLRRVATHLAASGALIPQANPAPTTALHHGADRGGAMAIVGMEARLPGARDTAEFWRNLTQGIDGVGPMTAERRELTGDASEFEGGYLADVDKFDGPFFGISRREALATDPRQRLFLEAAWRALEDAGIRPSSLAGSRTGVFVGIVGGSEYSGESEDAEVDSGAQRILGAATSLISARVSYLLDLRGPSHAIDTACSSSLVALHRAVSALRAGECEQAIVGGVNLVLDSRTTRAAAKTGMISPTARCRAFDVQADGYVRGEGVVALVVKPLSRALADGDPIHALILGTAENHGGRAAGLTAPNPEAQRDVIVAALERAGVGAETISYVEAHGTGTQLGDPIEINGLKAAFALVAKGAMPSQPWCKLGAVKSHIGHLEAAAGLAGVVKTILAMRAGTIPANLHFHARNPKVALDGSPFSLAETAQSWAPARDATGREVPRRAGVSSFGFSGVNAHVVLEEFRGPDPAIASDDEPVEWVLSAKTSESLGRRAAQLETVLATEAGCSLRDIATTLLAGREAMPLRASFVARDRAEAREILARIARGETDVRVRRDETRSSVPMGGRRIHLPAYPFERRSYWAKSSARSAPPAVDRATRQLEATQPVLDQHRVGDRPIFPAVAYLDWVLGVASDGAFRPHEFRSVLWARALEVGAQPVQARVKLEARGEESHFSVESGAVSGGLHARGTIRMLERASPPMLDPVEVAGGREWNFEEVYRFFVERGMHYGSLFRTLRRASVTTRAAYGELETDMAADDFILHPGLLDGVLQVAALLNLSSGGEPGMPFTAERIAIFAPLGRYLQVYARRSPDDTLELWAARPDGTVVLTLQGYAVRASGRMTAMAGANTSDSLSMKAEAAVQAHGETALGLDVARVASECDGMDRLEMLGRYCLLRELQSRGLLRAPGETVSRDELKRVLRAVPRYARLCDSLSYFLAQSGLVQETPTGMRATSRLGEPAIQAELAALPEAMERFCAEQPHFKPHATFVWSCIRPLPRIIDGSLLATDVMFPGGSVEFVSKIYDGTVLMDYFNRVAAVAVRGAVESLLRSRPPGSKVRIVEFGAGSGATSAWIAEELRDLGEQVEYVFTDISVAFRRHGEKRFGAQYPFMRFGVLNIERDPVAQGFAAGSFDIAIGANVLHTIKSLHRSLHLLKTLLAPGGMLALVEATQTRVLNGLTYGLLDGWWNFEDPERRLPNAPLCDEEQWLRALREEGFTDARVVGKQSAPARRMTQAVFLGVSDGRIAADVAAGAAAPQPVAQSTVVSAEPAGEIDLNEVLIEEVLSVVRHSLQAKDETTGLDATFESMGVDSILAVEIVEKLNQQLPLKLRTTDVFNYASIRRLARRMAEILDAEGRAKVLEKARRHHNADRPAPGPAPIVRPSPAPAPQTSPAGDRLRAPIAVVGMAGQYAEAANLDEFWANLAAARDCVREVPPDRWKISEHFSLDRRAPGKSYSKWGGFLKDAAGFDPIFFNCSPREADLMDPQQRLFLMECYHALENAGYSERRMDDQRCAVFAGVCAGDYQAQLERAGQWAEAHVFTGNATAILAGRLPYLLNLKGVGLAVDTACSSSLVAIHLACESLRAGSCTMALAGGVVVLSSERFHVWASKAGMLSATGRCHTFGAQADGMTPGEGVGVVALKLLDDAVRDGDHIHGVILGSGVNQNGKSNGITAPSVPAQMELETHVYREFGVDPATLDYVECHGTGTRLGDPMEVAALTDSFRQWTARTGFCALGAVKSNIGHALAAAGVAGLHKVLLALKHREIPASLHCGEVNEQLGLENSPFVVAKTARPWAKATTRRAAVSAFGFSGANAHAVIEEAPVRALDPRPLAPEHVFTLAAHTPGALRRKQEQLLAWLDSAEGRAASIADISYTLNVGRTHFSRRWVTIAETRETLIAALQAGLARMEADSPGKAEGRSGAAAAEQQARRLLAERTTRGAGLRGLVELYRAGHDLDWSATHEGVAGRRIPLPGYPFELRRCWIDGASKSGRSGLRLDKPERKDGTWIVAGALAADAPMLVQHRVRDAAILPGVASLEIVRRVADSLQPGKIAVIRAVTWLRPLPAAADGAETAFEVRVRESAGAWSFAVTPSGSNAHEAYAKGEIEWPARTRDAETLDLAGARSRCRESMAPEEFYARFEAGGVSYGPYFKVLRELLRCDGEVLARLELPAEWSDDSMSQGSLHPGLMDGALQAAAGLALDAERTGQGFRFPFGAGRVEAFGPLSLRLWVHVLGSIETGAVVTLADEQGRVLLRISDYVTRAPKAAPAEAAEAAYFAPTWQERALEAGVARTHAPVTGPVWLVAREEGDFERALASRHPDVVCIRLGRTGSGGSARDWTVDVRDTEAWSRLMRELPPPQTVYFSTGRIVPENFSDELACVQAAKEEGVLALFRLVKALQASDAWTPGLALKVAMQGVWTLPGEEAQPPYFAALAGFVGSLGREYPKIGAACIDLGEVTPETAGGAAAALACEPLRADSPRIAWRDGRRFEAAFWRMEVHG